MLKHTFSQAVKIGLAPFSIHKLMSAPFLVKVVQCLCLFDRIYRADWFHFLPINRTCLIFFLQRLMFPSFSVKVVQSFHVRFCKLYREDCLRISHKNYWLLYGSVMVVQCLQTRFWQARKRERVPFSSHKLMFAPLLSKGCTALSCPIYQVI